MSASQARVFSTISADLARDLHSGGMSRFFRSVAICILQLWLLPLGALASSDCAELAEQAGRDQGVPPGLMAAISQVETGYRGQPWPWTLNEGGKGQHFQTRAEAEAYLTDAVARGVRNIDVGCMQLNFHWHAAGFSSLDAMLDPRQNTRYAALFLSELKSRLGTWEAAAKHYHSADAARGEAYLAKVEQAWSGGAANGVQARKAAVATDPQPIGTGGSGPIVEVASSGPSMESIVLAAAQAAGTAMKDPRESLPLRKKSELPPRLQMRWARVKEMRLLMNGRN